MSGLTLPSWMWCLPDQQADPGCCRGVPAQLEAKVPSQKTCCSSRTASLTCIPSPCGTACRWFVLKSGKIYWFKTDSVSPVRHCAATFGKHITRKLKVMTLGCSCRSLCQEASLRCVDWIA